MPESATITIAATALVDYTVDPIGPLLTTPQVDAGADQIAHGPAPATIALAATLVGDEDATDPYTVFQWEQVSGPYAASLSAPTSAATDLVLATYAPGTWVLRVTATAPDDDAAAPITDTVAVTIPIDHGPYVGNATLQVTYPGGAHLSVPVSDDGWRGPLQYRWRQVGGPPATILTPHAPETDVVLPEVQTTFKFSVTVSNDLELLAMGYRLIDPLGGSRRVGVQGTGGDRPVPDFLAVALDGTTLGGVVVTASIDVRTEDSATSVTPVVYRDPTISGGLVTAGTVVATGDACTATSEDYDGTAQAQTLTVPIASGEHRYLLALTPSNGAHAVFGIGVLALAVP